MPLTITVTRSFTMTAGYAPSVDDWNSAFLPGVTVTGSVDSGDMADDAVTFAKLNPNLILGGTAITALAVGDLLLVGDLSTGDNRVISVANAISGIFSLAATVATAFTSYTVDRITLFNGTTAVTMTPAILAEQLVAQAPELLTTDDADEVIVRDASATDGSQAVRVALSNLLPAKGTAGVYTGVTGLTTDAKGRVTAVTTGTGTTLLIRTLTTQAIPASGVTTFPHGLGAVFPSWVRVVIKCTAAGGDAGYADNDELGIEACFMDNGTNDWNAFAVSADTTNVYVSRHNAGVWTLHRSTGANTALDMTKWEFLVRVSI